MEGKVVEAVMIDKEIDSLKQEIQDIIHTIERLNPNEYNLLHKVYVQNKTLKDVQTSEGRSYSWAVSTHNKAIKNLQRLLDEKCI